MRERDMVAGLVELRGWQLEAGRIDAPAIAKIHEAPHPVYGEDVPHAIGPALRDTRGIVREGLRRVTRLPAADAGLERLWQVPMVERGVGLDPVRKLRSMK